MFSKMRITKSTENCLEHETLKTEPAQADAVVAGAGAGLSTTAGFVYNGERFTHYFSDLEAKYGFQDMYSEGYYPYPTLEEYWAYWSRYIYTNRYMDAPKPVYDRFFQPVKDKDYFVILGGGYNTLVFCSLSTRRKLRKNTVKQQIQDFLFHKRTEYEERRCA